MAEWWDDDVAMLWNPPRSFDEVIPPKSVHVVPPTVWHALALLDRGADADVDRAVRAIHAVARCQYDEPGTPWHGTFARFREWPRPRTGATEWVDYDPNWRQFVGTGFLLGLRLFASTLPTATQDLMTASIRLALEGEPADRVAPSYSNIALMRAWLEVEGGALVGRDDLVARGRALADAVIERFDEQGGFDEWNSPTYYGIDLYALALWRSASDSLAAAGARLERALWDDITAWYHPGLHNLCGPYSRAYGMDMRSYAAAVGFWFPAPKPIPDLSAPFAHTHDLSLAPIAELLGGSPPAMPAVTTPRAQERIVSTETDRIASAWIAPDVMIGAERGARRLSGAGQYHPATIHWQTSHGAIGWIRISHAGPIEATAHPGALTVTVHPHRRRGPVPTRFVVSGIERASADRWDLPGLCVTVRSSAEWDGAHPAAAIVYGASEQPEDFELTIERV